MDLNERRGLLTTRDNPSRHIDYIIDLSSHHAKVRYVPDKIILDQDSLETYLAKIISDFSNTPEELAAVLLDDLSNELVPRWVHVHISTGTHEVVMEEQQPNWENKNLMGRLKAI